MESTNSQAKNQAKNQAMVDLSEETSANQSTREMSHSPKPEPNPSASMETSLPMASKPLEDLPMEQADDQEFLCRYCHKKFYNKQALGGHQNAHKVERALEKSAKERAKAGAGYLGNDFYAYPNMGNPYFPNSFQPMPNRYFPYSIPPAPYPHTMLPMAQEPYPPRLLLNPSNNYQPGWPRPLMATRPPIMANPGGNAAWFPPPGNGGTVNGGAMVGISEGPSSSDLVNEDNNQPEEAELDLTLKL